jgi:hypothetical protein
LPKGVSRELRAVPGISSLFAIGVSFGIAAVEAEIVNTPALFLISAFALKRAGKIVLKFPFEV